MSTEPPSGLPPKGHIPGKGDAFGKGKIEKSGEIDPDGARKQKFQKFYDAPLESKPNKSEGKPSPFDLQHPKHGKEMSSESSGGSNRIDRHGPVDSSVPMDRKPKPFDADRPSKPFDEYGRPLEERTKAKGHEGTRRDEPTSRSTHAQETDPSRRVPSNPQRSSSERDSSHAQETPHRSSKNRGAEDALHPKRGSPENSIHGKHSHESTARSPIDRDRHSHESTVRSPMDRDKHSHESTSRSPMDRDKHSHESTSRSPMDRDRHSHEAASRSPIERDSHGRHSHESTVQPSRDKGIHEREPKRNLNPSSHAQHANGTVDKHSEKVPHRRMHDSQEPTSHQREESHAMDSHIERGSNRKGAEESSRAPLEENQVAINAAQEEVSPKDKKGKEFPMQNQREPGASLHTSHPAFGTYKEGVEKIAFEPDAPIADAAEQLGVQPLKLESPAQLMQGKPVNLSKEAIDLTEGMPKAGKFWEKVDFPPDSKPMQAQINEPFAPRFVKESAESKPVVDIEELSSSPKSGAKEQPFAPPFPVPTQMPLNAAVPALAAVEQAQPYLSPAAAPLFYQMVGSIHMMRSSGVVKTEILLNNPAFENSRFFGTTITIEKYASAPDSFNIRLTGSEQAVSLFRDHAADIASAFQNGGFNFKVNRLDAEYTLDRPVFRRKEEGGNRGGSGGGGDLGERRR